VLHRRSARLLSVAAFIVLSAFIAVTLWLLVSFRQQSWTAQTIEAGVAVLAAAGGFANWVLTRSQRGVVTAGGTVVGLPVAVPTGELPLRVRGREDLLQRLHQLARRGERGPVILSGIGGIGKSTIAIAFAEISMKSRLGRRARHVWWVSAADQSSLTGGLTTVARQLGAGEADLEVIRAAKPDGPERLWRLLNESGRHWLLVLDNADDPSVLAGATGAQATAAAGGGTRRAGAGSGMDWIRASRRGLVLVTTRVDDQATWGRNAEVLPVGLLDEHQASSLLLDLAPHAGDFNSARKLADRLGGLPLALRIAGLRLGSVTAQRQNFEEYAGALDDPNRRPRMLSMTVDFGMSDEPRYVVMRTWELSLDDLARLGVPQARPLLRVLSCFAPAIPIPRGILTGRALDDLLAAGTAEPRMTAEDRLDDALRGLQTRGLIEIRPFGEQYAIIVQSIVADTNRIYLANNTDGRGLSAQIRGAALEILLNALRELNPDQSDDWQSYLTFGPHVHALYTTVAPQVGAQQLTELATATVLVARAYDFMGDIAEGEHLCRLARSMTDLLGADNTAVLRAGKELAWILATREEWAEAEMLYREVFMAFLRTSGQDNPNTITARHELAWVAGCQRRWQEAEAGYREVLSARTRVLGPEDKATLVTRHELAWAIENQDGREREARTILEDVLAARHRLLARHDRRILLTQRELAWIAAKIGDRSAATVAEYKNILASFRSDFGESHPETLATWQELAWALALAGKRRAALREYRNALRTGEHALGVSHPCTVATRRALDQLRHGTVLTPLHIV
jgi:tetratricopeptide (TPR) repeat protein